MSDDDDDYMSDKFLQNIKDDSSTSTSLIFKQSEKRKIGMLKRKAQAETQMKLENKSQRVMEIEKREEGLSMALSTDNKGFEMLMKMGYKPGCGVGKNPTGISEPISINIKTNRSGLGKITKPKLTTKINTTNKLDNLNATDFRERMAMKKAQQLIEHDLCTSRKACQQLDTNNNVDSPVQPWYWPIIEKKDSINDEKVDEEKEEEEEAEDNEEETDIPEVPIIEQLNILTDYLRNTYYYCIWCGATYDSLNDLNDNCPGNNRNEH